MRRDRTGELVDDDHAVDDHECSAGWIERFTGDPRPCPTCRPWLLERPARPPRPEELQQLAERLASTTTRRSA